MTDLKKLDVTCEVCGSPAKVRCCGRTCAGKLAASISAAKRTRSYGKRIVMGRGYVFVVVSPESPYASMRSAADGYVLEHRLVVAENLGRPLLRHEVVHHKNHDIKDNCIENLELIASSAEHQRLHMKDPERREQARQSMKQLRIHRGLGSGHE